MDIKYYIYISRSTDDRVDVSISGPYKNRQEWLEKSDNFLKAIEFELDEKELL